MSWLHTLGLYEWVLTTNLCVCFELATLQGLHHATGQEFHVAGYLIPMTPSQGKVCSLQLLSKLHGLHINVYHPRCYSSKILCSQMLQMQWVWPPSRSLTLSPSSLLADTWDDYGQWSLSEARQMWSFQSHHNDQKR